jgi:hypothetical protein
VLSVTTNDTDLTTMLPSEIDAILFPLWADRYRKTGYLLQYLDIADRSEFDAKRYERQIAEVRQELADIAAAIRPLDDEYRRRGGWERYDFVPDGHLHYYHCHTLRPTTQRLLVAEASGRDAEWIVENFAYAACTYCFPEAPVEARETYLKEIADAKRAAREEAKAAKAAKAAEKNLVEPVVVGGDADGRWAEKIVTVYAAKGWLKSFVEWGVWRGGHVSYPESGAVAIREALALKGIDTAPLEAKWAKAAAR